MLYIRWESSDGKSSTKRLVVPQAMQKELLYQLHDHPTGGHLGFEKVWSKLQPHYYWYQMKDSLKMWLAKCEICAKRRGRYRKANAPLQQYVVGEPMERIALDIMGPLPITEEGNRYILVITDYFTKFAEAYPMKNMEARTVSNILVKEFVCRYGVPRELHCDQGRQFESEVFQGLCTLLGIEKTRTSGYRPQSDGQTERFNRTLEDMLSKYMDPSQRDWDHFLPFVLLAYRSSAHASTGIAPNRAMFGREVALPLDLALGIKRMPSESLNEYVLDLQDTLVDVSQGAREQLQKAAKHQKHYYDRGKKTPEFKVGDRVLLSVVGRKPGVSLKLAPRWEGPYSITAQVSDVNFRIQARGKTLVVHADRLKAFSEPAPESPPQTAQTSTRKVHPPQRYGEWTV